MKQKNNLSSTKLNLFIFSLVLTIVSLKSYLIDNAMNNLNADFLLSGLMSISEPLTLFFWGSARFGNLIPILVSPVNDFDLNFSIQLFLNLVFFSLLIHVLNKSSLYKLTNTKQFFFTFFVIGISIFYIKSFAVLTWGFYSITLSTLFLIVSLISLSKNYWLWTFFSGISILCAFWLNYSTPIILFPIVIYFIFFNRRAHLPTKINIILYFILFTLNSSFWYVYAKNNLESVQINTPGIRDFYKVLDDFKFINIIFIIIVLLIFLKIRNIELDTIKVVILSLFIYLFQFSNLFLKHVQINGIDSRFFVISNFLTFYFLSLVLFKIYTIQITLKYFPYTLLIVPMIVLQMTIIYFFVFSGSPKVGGLDSEINKVLQKTKNSNYDFISGDYWIGWPVVIELQKKGIEIMAILPRSEGRVISFNKLSPINMELRGLCVGDELLCAQQITRYQNNLVAEGFTYEFTFEPMSLETVPTSEINLTLLK